jgi:peptidoglycan/xylan/chitin deacetylase (PgdA/CDA1 family)
MLVLLCSCRTITHSRGKLNIPPPVVYFSFDDGPNALDDTTARLLDVLNKYQIKAVFCLLGENVEHYPELTRRIYYEGRCIVNHGYADKWAIRMNDDEFRNNLVRGETAISAALGSETHPKLYRPHGGFYNSSQEKIIHDEGYILVPGNIRVYDAVVDGSKKNKVVKQVVRKIEKQGGGIILLHDARGSYAHIPAKLANNPQYVFNRSWIPETLEKIILVLLEKGYVLDIPVLFTAFDY